MGALDDKIANMLEKMIAQRVEAAVEAAVEKTLNKVLGTEAPPIGSEPEAAQAADRRGDKTASPKGEQAPDRRGGKTASPKGEQQPAQRAGEQKETPTDKLRPGAKIPRTDTRIGDVAHNRKITGLANRTPSGVRLVKVQCLGCKANQTVNIGSWRHGGCLKCSQAKKGDKAYQGLIDQAALILGEIRAYLVGKNMPGHLGNAQQFKLMCNLGYDPRIVGRAFSYLEAGKTPDVKLSVTKRIAGDEVLWAVSVVADKAVNGQAPPEPPSNGPRVVPSGIVPKAPIKRS